MKQTKLDELLEIFAVNIVYLQAYLKGLLEEDKVVEKKYITEHKKVYSLLKSQLKQLVLDCVPKKQKDDYKFFIENKSRGWTQEQLKERVWGYNQAREEILSNLKELFDE